MLRLVLRSPAQEIHEGCRVKDHKGDKGTGTADLQEKAERAGTVQPEEEKKLKRGGKEDGARRFSGAQRKDQRQQA